MQPSFILPCLKYQISHLMLFFFLNEKTYRKSRCADCRKPFSNAFQEFLFGEDEESDRNKPLKTSVFIFKNSISATPRIATKQPQRRSYTVKMRFGASENAGRGILLAATTKHFGSIGTSLGRLFLLSAALTN